MQDEEADLSFAGFGTLSAPKRPYTAPLLSDGPDRENAPDLSGRGRSLYLEHETGLAGGLRPLALAERSSATNRRSPRWQRVPTPGFRCLFPRNRRREPNRARARSSDATQELRAPPGADHARGVCA
jgi:hypothetical protein